MIQNTPFTPYFEDSMSLLCVYQCWSRVSLVLWVSENLSLSLRGGVWLCGTHPLRDMLRP